MDITSHVRKEKKNGGNDQMKGDISMHASLGPDMAYM
jgi:hypothetical protein